VKESLNLVLRLGSVFLDVERRDVGGLTPLLQLSGLTRCERDPESFLLLIKYGANIDARDDVGRNCLHVCLENLRFPARLHEFDSILLLVCNGADIPAIDAHGRSPSDVAYMTNWRDDELGSYRGDLWDAVLAKCGHNISDFRKGYPRTPRYRYLYTREDFEKLWLDREHQCPYYDDPPIWYHDGSRGGNDPASKARYKEYVSFHKRERREKAKEHRQLRQQQQAGEGVKVEESEYEESEYEESEYEESEYEEKEKAAESKQD